MRLRQSIKKTGLRLWRIIKAGILRESNILEKGGKGRFHIWQSVFLRRLLLVDSHGWEAWGELTAFFWGWRENGIQGPWEEGPLLKRQLLCGLSDLFVGMNGLCGLSDLLVCMNVLCGLCGLLVCISMPHVQWLGEWIRWIIFLFLCVSVSVFVGVHRDACSCVWWSEDNFSSLNFYFWPFWSFHSEREPWC